MPPKVRRRPAVAPEARHRPAARVRGPPALVAVDPVDVTDQFEKGEEIRAADCPLSLLKAGDWIRINEARYERGSCKVAGRVVRLEVEGTTWEVILNVSGTDSEDLLRVVTALERPHIRGHLCRLDCDQSRTNANLIHILSLQEDLQG